MQIYPHGAEEEADGLEADLPEASQQLLPPSLSLGANPSSRPSSASMEGRVHSKAYPTSGELMSGAILPRVEFPKLHAPVFSAPDWAGEDMEGQVRGGLPRVSSHPENLANLAAATGYTDDPFARCAFVLFSCVTISSLLPASILGNAFCCVSLWCCGTTVMVCRVALHQRHQDLEGSRLLLYCICRLLR